jgi:serine/threonine-protein kinase
MRLDSDSPDIMGLHAGDTTFVPLVATPASETGPQLSPDGKWLAYASDESGTFEIYVRPFPNVSSARWQISTSGGTSPLWAHSGKELFFRTKQGDVASVPVSTTSGFSVGTPRALFSAKPFRFSPQALTYNISPDDKRFLMMRETATGEAGQLIVSEHWLDDIESRKP